MESESCTKNCPVCCYETPEEIIARSDATIRNRALTLSNIAAVGLIVAHIVFSYNNRVLPIPDIAWAIILAPWLGAGGGKLLAAFKGK